MHTCKNSYTWHLQVAPRGHGVCVVLQVLQLKKKKAKSKLLFEVVYFLAAYMCFVLSGPDSHRSDQTRPPKEDLNGNWQAEHPRVAA